jgi:hypothetical protein
MPSSSSSTAAISRARTRRSELSLDSMTSRPVRWRPSSRLSSVAGAGMTEQLTAAVMLFRIAQWLAPIPIGWVLLIVLRRGHWGELRGGRDIAPKRSST